MQKMLIFLCTVIIGFSTAGLITASANNNASNIILSPETKQINGVQWVIVTLSTDFSAAGIQSTLNYDTSLVEFDSAEINPDINRINKPEDTVREKSGSLNILLIGNLTEGTQGNWLTLKFKVLNNAVGTAEFDLGFANCTSIDGTAISPTVSSTSLSVDGRITGDVNDDGIRNIKDLIRLKKFLSGVGSINTEKSDLNFNGKVESDDLVILKKLLLDFG